MTDDILIRMKTLEAKISEVADSVNSLTLKVQEGFTRMDKGFEKMGKDMEDLAASTGREFTAIRKEMATKEDLESLFTTEDIEEFRKNIRGDVEVVFDQRLGQIREDYDTIATRTKNLELATQKHGIV